MRIDAAAAGGFDRGRRRSIRSVRLVCRGTMPGTGASSARRTARNRNRIPRMSKDHYDDDLERGLRNRRRMLGDAWVDRSVGNATSFNAEFQQFITRYAWHEIWGRPGLEPKTRRIIVLAITTALGRWEEFELHLRAALTGHDGERLSPDEVKEVLMQAAIYAGVPAANTAFAHAQKILRELERAPGAADATQAWHPGVGRVAYTGSAPSLRYTVREARDGAARHAIVLSHALGCDHSMWDGLANQLAAEHRVIVYDHRGHGDSDAPPGPYTMAQLADDALRVLDDAGANSVVWIGLSMGGMVGQELALRHPARVQALVIANSTGAYPEAALPMWQQRIDAVTQGGMPAIVDMVLARYFSDDFRVRNASTVARFARRLRATDAAGYLACSHAVRGVDTLPRLSQLRLPALVIAGERDEATPVALSQAIAERLPGAQLVVLPGAAHISVIEQPEAFAQAVREFIDALR
jgi:3-oxoadipate enol-lactonase